ncbi:hypothetical protein [Streptomyces sp. NPDC089799]|uniref:hypothetical protein n=1 Tax=Streptomyces sp. NPDC089799 TaxID=3155066 RepID=UPI0034327BC5
MTSSTTLTTVRLGTRPSPMALEQTTRFADTFRAGYPQAVLDIVEIVSDGDRHHGPLSAIGGKGAFTRNADRYLLDGLVQATIACAKDVPGPHDRSPGVIIGAVLPREDTRDALVLPTGHPATTLAELPPGTRVGVIVEHRADDPATGEVLAPLTHGPTRILLDAERAALATLHGGCLTAASAHATLDAASGVVTVHAAVLDPTGGDPLRACASGPSTSAHEVGQDAGQQLLDAGAERLLGRSA